jgi:PilZ domain
MQAVNSVHPQRGDTMPETRYSVSRANARFSFIAEAEVAEVGNAKGFVARISELSSLGCYVDTVNPFPDGTELRISIRYGCSACDFTGRVIYTHPGFGMGVRFGETTAEDRATLDAWLDELAHKSS